MLKPEKKPKKIWQLITKKRWCRNTFSDGHGAHCAVGWIDKVYVGDKNILAKRKLEFMIKDYWISITNWNDNPETKFEDVYKAFKKANI